MLSVFARAPGARFAEAGPDGAQLDVGRARAQHAELLELLRTLGARVDLNPEAAEASPLSCCVGDLGADLGELFVLCRPAHAERRGEVDWIAAALDPELALVRVPATRRGRSSRSARGRNRWRGSRNRGSGRDRGGRNPETPAPPARPHARGRSGGGAGAPDEEVHARARDAGAHVAALIPGKACRAEDRWDRMRWQLKARSAGAPLAALDLDRAARAGGQRERRRPGQDARRQRVFTRGQERRAPGAPREG
ncbi:MAG: hypothetical protein FJ299_02665 [Planctomycetes bacterium]|nr:hypothetical protein [Planctomycetota bacterium]